MRRERRPVRIVGDLDHVRPPTGLTVRSREPEIERLGVGSEHRRQRGQGGVDLGVPILGRSHDGRVQAERHVVDEDPPVDLGEVHRPLPRFPERVERSHHVVPIQPEIEREVIAGPRGDDHHRNPSFGGDARDERLRPVAAGHPDHVGPVIHGSASQVEHVVARLEDHGLDTPLPTLVHQVEALRLPASGLQVHDQDPVGRRTDGNARRLALLERPHVATEGEPREGDGEQQQHQANEQGHRTPALPGDPHEHEPRERGEDDQDRDRPAAADARQRVPRGERGRGEQHELRRRGAGCRRRRPRTSPRRPGRRGPSRPLRPVVA